jgi:hypothetical protein
MTFLPLIVVILPMNLMGLVKDSPILPNPKLKGASNCRACGTHITFKKLENGKSVAVQDDSNLHRCVEWKNWSSDEG